jgi:uncharacterized integral membrane protein (TIGR00698 family)
VRPEPFGVERDPSDSGARAGATGLWLGAHVLPGLGVAIALAALATVPGQLVPVVGAPVFAIVVGILVSPVSNRLPSIRSGLSFSSKYVLQGAIVALGTGLSFHQVIATGSSSLPVLLGTLAVALLGAAVIGRRMSIDRDLRTLIGVGTGICGASAIAATDAVIGASDVDVSYAIATIFTFNVVAVLTFPAIGHLLNLSPNAFGLWAGTAVNDTSSVVAASSIFGHGAVSTAIVTKLTRTLMILPISIGVALWRAWAKNLSAPDTRSWALRHVHHVLPAFIGWFLIAVTINTVGIIPHSWHTGLGDAAQFMITVALAAIGLSTRLRAILHAGFRPLALGAILWVLVAVTSLSLQLASGTLRHA